MEVAEREILLKEYEQALDLRNSTETLVRKDIRIFILFLSAILISSIYKGHQDILAQVFLLIVGMLISLLFSITIYRNRTYYRCYLDRAKEIERKLGMELLKSGETAFRRGLADEDITGRCSAFGKFARSAERQINCIVGCYADYITNKLAYLLLTLLGIAAFLLLAIGRIIF